MKGDAAASMTTEVFAVPVQDGYLVYAPLRRIAFLANSASVNLLYLLRQGKELPAGKESSDFLGFCDRVGLFGGVGDCPVTSLESPRFNPTEVTLFLTTSCNLRCIYCYASAGDRHMAAMDLETAKRGIDFVCSNAAGSGKPSFTVGYHGGGEPTEHWGVLTGSFAYARELAREKGLEVEGSMATNGVLSPEKCQWVMRNFEGVNISVDGLPAIQDIQRPLASGKGSSAAVLQTIREFDNASYRYGLRVTVTGASVDDLPRSIEYLLEQSHPEHIQVESVYLLGRGRSQSPGVDPAAFVDAFRQARSLADKYGVDLFYSASRVDMLTDRFCLSCGEGFSLTPQGHVSACYEVPDGDFQYAERFIFGTYDEKCRCYRFDEEKLGRLRNHTVESVPWCRDCFCKWHCAGDCAYKAHHAMVDGQFVGDPRCEITRALTVDQILEKIRQQGGLAWSEPFAP